MAVAIAAIVSVFISLITSFYNIHYGFIVDINITEENETIIDEVMVTVMKAPRSYTTEDTVESFPTITV